MAFWISVAMTAYILIGLAFAIGFYIQEDGDRNDSEIIFDVFVWPMVVIAAAVLLVAIGTRKVGDWIIKKKEA
jgi:hypothetical protein